MHYNLFLWLFWAISLSGGSLLANPIDLPTPQNGRFVYDKANFCSATQTKSLEQAVQNIYAHTQNQIAILTIEDIGNQEISNYAIQLGRKWGIGKQGKDNGILCLFVKKTRQVWIATGYKIEPLLPDVVTKRIIDQVIIPAFANGKYYLGMQKTIYYLVENLSKEENLSPQASKFYQEFLQNPNQFFHLTAKQPKHRKTQMTKGEKLTAIVIGIGLFILLIVILRKFGDRNDKNGGGGMAMLNTLMLAGLFSGMFSDGRSGGRGGDSRGGGSFGGGSFGGGGAGGRW